MRCSVSRAKYYRPQRKTGSSQCSRCRDVVPNITLNIDRDHPRTLICDECVQRRKELGLV